jgi:hypothetical protein
LSSVFTGSCDEFGVLTWSRSILYTVLLPTPSGYEKTQYKLTVQWDEQVKCSEVNLSVIEPLKMVTFDRNVRRAFV